MSERNRDDLGGAVHASSASPEEPREGGAAGAETDLEIEEESQDSGWDEPGEKAAPPIASSPPAAAASSTLMESTPPGSRKLAPPPKPRQKSMPSEAGEQGSPAIIDPGVYGSGMPPAPAIPTIPQFPSNPELVSKPLAEEGLAAPAPPPTFDSLVEPAIDALPPPPVSHKPFMPPRPNSNPPPRYRSYPPGVGDLSELSRPRSPSQPNINLEAAAAYRKSAPELIADVPPAPPAPPAPPLEARADASPPQSPSQDSSGDLAPDSPVPSAAAALGGSAALSDVLAAAASVVGAAEEPVSSPVASAPLRRSEPAAPPTHIVVPTDDVPPPSKPTPAPAIHVMRIIAVGTPSVQAPAPEIHTELTEDLGSDDITEEPPEVVAKEEPEELSESDVAPDSDRGETISIPPEEVESSDPAAAAARKAEAKPPPPPRRPPSAKADGDVKAETKAEAKADVKAEVKEESERKAPPTAADVAAIKSKRQKRPWWEELFGEDFVRANFRVTDDQVEREVTFIEESLGVAPGGVVLDLGCGTGHHAVELATRGYGVVGYDLSLYQLALAAEVAQEKNQKINFLQGDMREMAFDEMFDGVYCWNTTFGYFEEEKNLNVAQRVFKALRPGGMFLVDVVNRDFAASQSPTSLWFEGDSCVCMDDMSVDFITSRLRVKRAIILDDGRTKECSYSIRLYSMHELGKLLHEVGFRVIEASGHPAMPGVFFGQCSPRIIMLAQKP